MSENRNLILAIVLSVAILSAFHFLYEVPHLDQLRRLAAQEHSQDAGSQVSRGNDTPAADISTLGQQAVLPRAEALTGGGTRISIGNPRVYGSLPLKGARFDNLTFTDYFTTVNKAAHVDLLSPSGTESPYFATVGWLPAQNDTPVPGDDTVWKTDGDPHRALSPDHPVSLIWDNGRGLVFHRTVSIDANYMFTVADKVTNNGQIAVDLVPFATINRQGSPTPAANSDLGLERALGVFDGHLAEESYKALSQDKLTPEEVTRISTGGWIGFGDKYWLVAAIPDQQEAITAEFRHIRANGLDTFQTDYRGGAKSVAPGATITETTHLFAGAKQVELLKAYRDDLNIPKFDLAVDWGFFWFLSKPFFYCIHFLATRIGNFGLAILAFTFVIRIAILPLAWKMNSTMARMGELTPKLNELKDRHGTDKQSLQKELMTLYTQEGVNPLSGCLPVFLQLPIFWALFKVLSTTIEMRQVPFYWYVRDLSAPDPTNLFNLFGMLPDYPFLPHIGFLPLVLGGTLLLLQLQAPKQADPLHNKMMLINPVLFTWFMRSMPVGLVIYYILSNSISVVQSRAIKKIIKWKREKAST